MLFPLPARDQYTCTDILPFFVLLRNPIVTKQDDSPLSHRTSENSRTVISCGCLVTLHRDMSSAASSESEEIIQAIPLLWSQLWPIMWPLTLFTMGQHPLVTFGSDTPPTYAFQGSRETTGPKDMRRLPFTCDLLAMSGQEACPYSPFLSPSFHKIWVPNYSEMQEACQGRN